MYLRIFKILAVLQVGLFALLVAINNIVDYGSNFMFVQHVLLMDTTFPTNALMGRSIDSPFLHHAFYSMIIAAEFLTGVFCIWGSWVLFGHRSDDISVFNAAKLFANTGLMIGFSLWFTGFMTVGAEWFLMWQSEIWNGQDAAFRFIAIILMVMLFLNMPESE